MRIRWTILAVLFLARTAMGFQFQSIGALSPLLAAPVIAGALADYSGTLGATLWFGIFIVFISIIALALFRRVETPVAAKT
jgi:hypothetical protein